MRLYEKHPDNYWICDRCGSLNVVRHVRCHYCREHRFTTSLKEIKNEKTSGIQ